jgi:SAM-dependent methyltransferase
MEMGDTYHTKVLLPNLERIVGPMKGVHVLEIGCGEGFFARAFAKLGATVIASDIGKDLVVAVLTLQNMEKIEPVMKEIAKVLRPGGRFICVLNHPIFRIPKATAWGYDDVSKIQYRRIDAYLSARREKMDMHPGKRGSKSFTYSFHRSLQDYMKAFRGAGFLVARLEEWISHKTSEQGPRAKAENSARKEFPLFMLIEAHYN